MAAGQDKPRRAPESAGFEDLVCGGDSGFAVEGWNRGGFPRWEDSVYRYFQYRINSIRQVLSPCRGPYCVRYTRVPGFRTVQ